MNEDESDNYNIKVEADVINKYIDLYKYCSNIVIYSNGKLNFIKKRNKNQLKFTI